MAERVDVINHPSHYFADNGLEAIDVLEAFFPDDPLGWQVGKYILRYKKKGGLEDLQKAQVYLSRLIARVAGDPEDIDPVLLDEPLEYVEAELVPRVWDLVEDVPPGVPVKDCEGDTYRKSPSNGLWEYRLYDGVWVKSGVQDPQEYAPFTEVIA